MKRITVLIALFAMVFTLVSCGGSSGLSDDEQLALSCVKKAPYISEDEIADSLYNIYIVKDSDQTVKYVVVNYSSGFGSVEAVFKDGEYYIDANETFDTSDTSNANLDRLIAQRDVRFVDSGLQPEEWEVVTIDKEKIIKALE